ncbi:IS630 family transposase [Frankia tisae]|uniref:IS630 family transposase n=1 Tax=Frankia tisae TaxID=2950104 RepID=UPI0021BF962B|nr:IS630 family transposase [Frankia tisae]
MTEGAEKRILRRSLEETRFRALEAIDRGCHPADVAVMFGAGVSTVYGWMQTRRERGSEALKVRVSSGPAPKLTDEQAEELWRLVACNDPRRLRFDSALWTREMVRELIRREFGVEYTPQGVGQLMRRMGLSPQRPLTRAWEQDSVRVRRWKEEEYPEIHREAEALGASIFFEDEASVRTDYHAGTTWAPVGCTPVVRGTGNRKTVNMMSAVSARGKLHFSLLAETVDSAVFIEFLEKLLHDVDGTIFLVVDGHGSHTSQATREYVESTEGKIRLFRLPPYSPELNPDEWVWKNVKHDNAGRLVARTVDELRQGIQKAFDRLWAAPEIIRDFFKDPDLEYINI